MNISDKKNAVSSAKRSTATVLSPSSGRPAAGQRPLYFSSHFSNASIFFVSRRIHLCTRMTGGLCYFETFKAELSLVILCLTSQEVLLTLKPSLLNGCVCPPLMCTSINKRCRCWQFLLAFIHISPLWPCKSKTTLKTEVCS